MLSGSSLLAEIKVLGTPLYYSRQRKLGVMADNAMPPTKEGNSVSLQYQVLNKTNYIVSSLCMKAIFNVNGAWEMIDTGTSRDRKRPNMAVALLFQALLEGQIMQVGNYETAKEMWDSIKSRHLGADRVWDKR